MSYLVVIVRTILFYVVITSVYRFMGKREIGELSVVDLIVSIMLAELATGAIEDYKQNIFLSLIPIVLLVLIQIILAKIVLHSDKIRSVFEGEPSVIINRGKVNFKEMLKQRYNLDDLLTQLRSKGIKSLEEVSYAILEVNGDLSVFTKDGNVIGSYPLPVILDGKIQEDTLKEIDKSRSYILDKLNNDKLSLEDVFYAFYHDKKLFVIKKDK